PMVRWPPTVLGTRESRKTTMATMALFHTVAAVTCSMKKVERSNQIASTVSTQRTEGERIAQREEIAIRAPTIHVLVPDACVCGHANAEMNSHTPSAAFT